MKVDIKKYLDVKFPNKFLLRGIENKNSLWFIENQKTDAINGYKNIKKYLKKNIKIMEIGGGMHFLSNYLVYLNYDVTSIEPGGFRKEIDIVRKRIVKIKEKKLKIEELYLENFFKKYSKKKFDFCYLINVLEHTKNIKEHLMSNEKLLKDEKSICHIRCPNYTFPFESHFYLFFIPFLPHFTFRNFYEKKLKKKYGKRLYFSILNTLNFDCSYFKIKKIKLNISFLNSVEDIFNRIDKSYIFRRRILSNKIIKLVYKIIISLKLKKFLFLIFPNFMLPYLIMNLKKKT